MNKLPGPKTTASACIIASRTGETASGSLLEFVSVTQTRLIRLSLLVISFSPAWIVPSINSAFNVNGSLEAGKTCPSTRIIFDNDWTASKILPCISFKAAIIKLPIACPEKNESDESKRY